ncbi:hypothetical protein LXL04_013076 [Taraxacum kok-saghyz]
MLKHFCDRIVVTQVVFQCTLACKVMTWLDVTFPMFDYMKHLMHRVNTMPGIQRVKMESIRATMFSISGYCVQHYKFAPGPTPPPPPPEYNLILDYEEDDGRKENEVDQPPNHKMKIVLEVQEHWVGFGTNETLPFTYLGLPVGANMNLKKNWTPVIEKFNSRLSTWKAQSLSLGGRLTLAKAVLGSLPSYYFSIFVAPVGVINSIEKIRRRFLWGGSADKSKISWVAWDKVAAPKEAGGLGLGSLKAFNLSLIVKWWWRLRKDDNEMWCKVINGVHNLRGKPDNYLSNKSISGVWNNIAGVAANLEKMNIKANEVIVKDTKAGKNTMFWLDKWRGEDTFKEAFPLLYKLDRIKKCKVADRINSDGTNWDWRPAPSSSSQKFELERLRDRIGDFTPLDDDDRWRSGITDDGMYRVKALRYKIDCPQQIEEGAVINWTHDVPLKVLCFVWRVNRGRIPTATELLKRGIAIDSPICTYCSLEDEDTLHVLWGCQLAKTVWEWVLKWCDIPFPAIQEIGELLKYVDNQRNREIKKRDLVAICYGTLWLIWKSRCDWIFKKIRVSPTKVADKVKSTVYTWVKHRQSRSFKNSYIPENPRTPKPLTFSKNRLRGLKIAQIQARSLYNTYLNGFVKKNLKKKRKKKKLHICKKI